jgi:hypothetical protein
MSDVLEMLNSLYYLSLQNLLEEKQKQQKDGEEINNVSHILN